MVNLIKWFNKKIFKFTILERVGFSSYVCLHNKQSNMCVWLFLHCLNFFIGIFLYLSLSMNSEIKIPKQLRFWINTIYIFCRLLTLMVMNTHLILLVFNPYNLKMNLNLIYLLNELFYSYFYIKMRLWRKNRQITYYSSCLGIDLNRNFGFKWFLEV